MFLNSKKKKKKKKKLIINYNSKISDIRILNSNNQKSCKNNKNKFTKYLYFILLL